jgi:hypothetical protein
VPSGVKAGQEGSYAVYYVKTDGTKERVTGAKFEDGYVTFTATHFSTYIVDGAGYTIKAVATTTNADQTTKYYDVGDEISVDIQIVSATGTSSINAFEFTLDYDTEKLTFESLTLANDCLSTGGGDSSANGTHAVYAAAGNSYISVNTDGTTVATAKFTVKSDSDTWTGTKTANVGVVSNTAGTNLVVKATDTGVEATPSAQDVTVNVANITVTVNAGSNGTLTVGDETGLTTKTLYAKYGEAGLYTDNTHKTTATVTPAPSTNYTFSGWKVGEATELSKNLPTSYTDDTTLVANFTQASYDVTTSGNGDLHGGQRHCRHRDESHLSDGLHLYRDSEHRLCPEGRLLHRR